MASQDWAPALLTSNGERLASDQQLDATKSQGHACIIYGGVGGKSES